LTLPPTLRVGAAAEEDEEEDLLPPLVTLDEEEEDEEEGAFCVTVLRKGEREEERVMMRRRVRDRDGKKGLVQGHMLKHGCKVPLAGGKGPRQCMCTSRSRG